MTSRCVWAAALLAALAIAIDPAACLAQAPAAKAPAAKAPPKVSRAVQKALADHRRNIGRALRGGPDDYYVVVLGEITDRPREPNLLDALQLTTTAMAFAWDVLFIPIVLIVGDGEEILMSHKLPPLRSNIERTYQHEVRVVHTKAAAIEAIYDYTTGLVEAPPKPPEQKYRAWAFAGLARTDAAAQEAKAAVDAKLTGMAAKPAGFLDQVHEFLDQLGKAGDAGAEPKADPKAAPKVPAKKAPAKGAPADAGALRERAQKMLDEAGRNPERLEKFRELMQRDFFGAPP
jgi:hypothetical protein